MTSIRSILIIAWLTVGAFLWLEWSKEQSAPADAPAIEAAADLDEDALPPPSLPAAREGASAVPRAPGSAPAMTAAAPAAGAAQRLELSNDVLRLTLDGGSVRRAELLQYRESRKPDAPLVRLLDDSAGSRYLAQSGWVSERGAPTHEAGFRPEGSRTRVALGKGEDRVSTSFVWTGADGVTIRRTYTLARGDYALRVRDEIVNGSAQPWTGYIYRQLSRIPPTVERSMTDPDTFSFRGAAWYTPKDKYDKRAYEDFVDDGPLGQNNVQGGWVALLQHYFFTGWVPQKDQAANYALQTRGRVHAIAATGPEFTVAPGAKDSTEATLWVGPKLPDRLQQTAPGLDLTLDYGIFTLIAEPIHWTLRWLHAVTGNWGWAIVLLVVIIKLLMYPLSAAQYKSMAKMRKFQPRLQQLKERYGEDKQKLQMATFELYKKEKINPAGGCLPILIQMPVFLALYWVLLESVELRQAPWMLWIQDLTARDPYFILPVINAAVMWYTQKLTPMTGMDPMQQRIFQFMPLVFGVMFALFPSGLVLYWVTNGAIGLIQQIWMMRIYGDKDAKK